MGNYGKDKEQVYNNDNLYSFLLLYFLEDLSFPPYYDEIMNSPDQKETICKYLEQWIPQDEKLVQYLNGSRANLKRG